MNKSLNNQKTTRIIFEGDYQVSAQNSIPKFLEASELSTIMIYETFIDYLNNSGILDPTKNYMINLKENNGERLKVNKNSFDKIKEKIFSQEEKDNVYFIVTELSNKEKGNITNGYLLFIIYKDFNESMSYLEKNVKPILDELITSLAKYKPDNAVIIT